MLTWRWSAGGKKTGSQGTNVREGEGEEDGEEEGDGILFLLLSVRNNRLESVCLFFFHMCVVSLQDGDNDGLCVFLIFGSYLKSPCDSKELMRQHNVPLCYMIQR